MAGAHRGRRRRRASGRSPRAPFSEEKGTQEHTPTLAATHKKPLSTRLPPHSQSFSQSYGSILPTSLTYIVLSTRGCSPWRPDAVISTARGANHASPSDFQGWWLGSRTGQTRWTRSASRRGSLGLKPFHPAPRLAAGLLTPAACLKN